MPGRERHRPATRPRRRARLRRLTRFSPPPRRVLPNQAVPSLGGLIFLRLSGRARAPVSPAQKRYNQNVRIRFLIFFLALLTALSLAQESPNKAGSNKTASDKTASQSREATDEESSSHDTRVDTSPPKDDAKNHPGSKAAVADLDIPENIETSGVQEFHPWNPMKALKDIEVGDY